MPEQIAAASGAGDLDRGVGEREESRAGGARPERRLAWLAAFALLLLGAAVAWTLYLRPALALDTRALAQLPPDLGAWRSEDLPIDSGVESMLRADLNLQRAYRHPSGDVVWVYVGYYGTARGGRPEHTPHFCYTAHGWKILEERVIDVDPARDLRAVELLVEQAGDRRLVHFWYQSFRRAGILGIVPLLIDHLLGNLSAGRADGSLVRFSTPVDEPGDEPAARSRLRVFADRFERELAAAWPLERSPAAPRTAYR